MKSAIPHKARSLVAAAAAATLICTGVAHGAEAAKRAPLNPAVKVRIGIISALFDTPSIIAHEKGYFREEGIDSDIKAFPGSAEASQALSIGALDAIASGPNPMVFNARQRNIDLTIVASAGQHSPGRAGISCVLRKDLLDSGRYKTPADLKGMKLASGLAAPSSWFVSEIARQHGVTEKQFDIVQVGLPNVVAGMGNKSIDGGCINEPHATLLLKRVNGVRIMSMDEFKPNFPNGYLIYGPLLTRKNPEAGKRYMIAYVRAIQDYRAAFFGPQKKGNAEIVSILKKYNMEVLPDTMMVDFPEDAAPSFTAVDDLIGWHIRLGNIRSKPDLKVLTDDSFRLYALDQLGVRK
jgi:NitT/TauT family transport system substrate-binding protein